MYGLDEMNMTKGMHLGHINIRSITNKWDVFKTQFLSTNLHILTISETWLNEKLPSEFYKLTNNYTFLRNDRNWSDEGHLNIKKGGGVALYVKNSLNYSDVDFIHLNTNNKNIESQWVSIKQPNSRTILIGNVYRPPQGNIETFIQVLEDILTSMDLSKIELFIMGDLNIDILEKKNPNTKKLLELIKTFGLRQLIKTPTRYSKDKNSCITVILVGQMTIQNQLLLYCIIA